jgi:hypothetical protein
MTCTVIDQIDVWALATSLRGRRKDLVSVMEIRGGGARPALLKEWSVMRQVLNQLDKHAATAKADIDSIVLEKLEPDDTTPWGRRAGYGYVLLPIVTNPAAFIFSGPRAPWHAEAGALVLVDQSWPVTVVNWGKSTHIHLMIWLNTIKDE